MGRAMSSALTHWNCEKEERQCTVPSKNRKEPEGKNTEQEWPHCCALCSARQEARV